MLLAGLDNDLEPLVGHRCVFGKRARQATASARDRKGSRLGACDPEEVRTAGLTSAPTAKPGASRAAHGDDCRPTRPYGDCGRYLARRRRAERSHRRLACPKRQRGASPSVRKPLGSRTSSTPSKRSNPANRGPGRRCWSLVGRSVLRCSLPGTRRCRRGRAGRREKPHDALAS